MLPLRSRWVRLMPVAILAIALGAGCARLLEDWSDASVAESQLRGGRIAAALERYRRDQMTYPADLDALVPQYLAEIEPPVAGNGAWVYTPLDRNAAYNLCFGGSRDDSPSHIYDSRTQKWSLDTQ